MEHLTLETLARLVDEEPTAEERAHLEICRRCRDEGAQIVSQTEGLRALPDLRPPVGDWDALESRLLVEGLISPGTAPFGRGPSSGARLPAWMQAAAAVVIFVGGAISGVAFSQARPAGSLTDGGGFDLASLPIAEPSSPEEAAEAVREAERIYYNSLVRFQELADDRRASPGDPGRFAAIDALLAASQAAVRQAPADPFLNGILVSTLAERQAALRRISSTGTDNWY